MKYTVIPFEKVDESDGEILGYGVHYTDWQWGKHDRGWGDPHWAIVRDFNFHKQQDKLALTLKENDMLKKALHEIKRLGLVKLHDDAFFFDKARFAENRLAEIVATANDVLNALNPEV